MRLKLKNIDTKFSNPIESKNTILDLLKKYAEEDFRKASGITNVTVDIIPSKDVNDQGFDFVLKGPAALIRRFTQEQQKDIVVAAGHRAFNEISDQREKVMLSHVHKYGNAVITTGFIHGEGLLLPLRKNGDIDMTVTITDKAMANRLEASYNGSAETKRRGAWAGNPANAMQSTDKEFNHEGNCGFY